MADKILLRNTNVIQEYNDGKSITELAKKYNVTRQAVSQFLRRQGIVVEKRIFTKTPYPFNEHWLDELDCEEKYYFLGFFAADGYNYEKENQIKIKIQQDDKILLDKFNQWFDSNRPLWNTEEHKVRDGKEVVYKSFTLVLTSKYLCQRLSELGMPQTKTETIRFPKNIPQEYMNHYIRGYFDGDGSISITRTNAHGEIIPTISIVGNVKFIEALKNILTSEINISPVYSVSNTNTYAVLKIAKLKDIETFGNYIYNNSNVSLQRKQVKFEEFLNSRTKYRMNSKDKKQELEAKFEEILEKYNKGISAMALGKEYNRDCATITSLLKRHGIEVRNSKKK